MKAKTIGVSPKLVVAVAGTPLVASVPHGLGGASDNVAPAAARRPAGPSTGPS